MYYEEQLLTEQKDTSRSSEQII